MTAEDDHQPSRAGTGDAEWERALPAPRRNEIAGNSSERAANYLRRLIFARVLPAGTRVPQEEVARALGVTRIPVREALLTLELEGRVRVIPNRGAFVVTVTEQSAQDAIELLTLVHSFAAHRAIERSTPEFVDDLRKANERVQATTDLVELYYAFDAFHDVIVQGGLDARLAAFIRRLRRLSPDTLYEHDPSIATIVKRAAERMYRALVNGDIAKVEKVMHASHESILKRMTPLLRNDGLMKD
jgi:DNA-binding GntR family transcriptional regulator